MIKEERFGFGERRQGDMYEYYDTGRRIWMAFYGVKSDGHRRSSVLLVMIVRVIDTHNFSNEGR